MTTYVIYEKSTGRVHSSAFSTEDGYEHCDLDDELALLVIDQWVDPNRVYVDLQTKTVRFI